MLKGAPGKARSFFRQVRLYKKNRNNNKITVVTVWNRGLELSQKIPFFVSR